ncbi:MULTISPECIES: flagellar assembly peptidoglycan hydrolase FlgJ [Colwellia]|uniref:Peptidoglycan hydrolase FlgJ n=1 Tax=Colwellia marinimaniae TaxID=1513592 RepID=A0ABQ0MVA1_9GAMM|nr:MULTISPECIES: flagellar assembly peptidoglycan hydrolase FlgJ [Colwellia]GAW96278.1 flagellar rod assembly protein/muramidase FlgJ [Colwellia marinimaniae]
MDINLSQNYNFDQARNALELNGLNAIRQQSRATDDESKQAALKEAAQQFEAIFMRMLLSSMRKAQDVLESDSPFNSETSKFYRDMHDQQMAIELSSNGSLGLSDLIIRQLGGDSSGFKPSSVLRNDGNLPSFHQVNSADDKVANSSKGDIDKQHNSLVEKMLMDKSQIKPDIDIPFAGSYQNNNSVSNQIISGVSQLPINAANKATSNNIAPNIDNIAKQAQSVNISAPIAAQSFDEPKDFVRALVAPAKKVQQQLGVPFEVIIAQAALETGWGQKIIKDQDGASSNNLFNIKADSRWSGDKVSKETLEFEQGTMVKKSAQFRMYQSFTDSINDYINFLSTSERYQDALQNSGNVEHFLQGLQKAGYATDPQYADKILGTLKTVTNLLAK